MSSSKTVNYNLHKWLATDKMQLSELNENWDSIDSKLKELNDLGKTLNSTINTVKSSIETLDKSVKDLSQSKVDSDADGIIRRIFTDESFEFPVLGIAGKGPLREDVNYYRLQFNLPPNPYDYNKGYIMYMWGISRVLWRSYWKFMTFTYAHYSNTSDPPVLCYDCIDAGPSSSDKPSLGWQSYCEITNSVSGTYAIHWIPTAATTTGNGVTAIYDKYFYLVAYPIKE